MFFNLSRLLIRYIEPFSKIFAVQFLILLILGQNPDPNNKKWYGSSITEYDTDPASLNMTKPTSLTLKLLKHSKKRNESVELFCVITSISTHPFSDKLSSGSMWILWRKIKEKLMKTSQNPRVILDPYQIVFILNVQPYLTKYRYRVPVSINKHYRWYTGTSAFLPHFVVWG